MEFNHTITNTKLYLELVTRNSNFISKVNDVISYSDNVLPLINNVFSNYTGHGISHSFKIMEYMYDLIQDISLLSDLEITTMIYVGLLHDVGMVVTDEEIQKIKCDDDAFDERKFSLVLEKYHEENIAIQEYIRPIHGQRSGIHIDKYMNPDLFILPYTTNISFIDEVKNICASHNENFEWLKANLTAKEIKGEYVLNSQFIALLLRIADLLDIDESRTPMYLYQLVGPKGYGALEWEQHFVIENKNKIAFNKQTGQKVIEFYGKSNNPKIHRKLLKYFDYINYEVKNSVELAETFLDKEYYLWIKPNIENKIQTKGFNFSDFKLSLDYNAVTNLLMGENIYGDKKYGLRELIQNSIDACKSMLEIAQKKPENYLDEYKPYINIVLDKDKKQVCVIDNGTGMNLDILKKYFLNVGVSYYSSDEYKFKGLNYKPIGNYGIGFLASFMLSDNVTVKTKRYDELKLYEIDLEKNSEYICLTYKEDARIPGTEIILSYDEFFNIFKPEVAEIQRFVEQNFINNDIQINIIKVENGEYKRLSCDLIKIKDNSGEIARLDRYLIDVECCLEINAKDIRFVEKLEDTDGNTSYIYCGLRKLIAEADIHSIDIQKFVQNNKIEYLRLPIIPEHQADKFKQAFEVLDDFDGALDKINDHEFINIFCDDIGKFNYKELIKYSDDTIVGDFTFEDFCRCFQHCADVCTYTYLIENDVITINDKKILPYLIKVPIGGVYSWNRKDKIFIRNVFIPQFNITIPYLITGLQIKGGLFNILNKNMVPNVSRNNVSIKMNEEFSYSIGKALHLWILDNVNLKYEEQMLVREFIKVCYPNNNLFLKNYSNRA